MSDIYFFKYIVNRQVFFRSKHCYALVNLKPLVPGHVLVVPYNPEIRRFNQLNDEESIDYMRSLQIISKFITWKYKADSLNIAIQDGPESGQSIPHLHTHIIPRYKADPLVNDRVHREIEAIDVIKDFQARREAFLNKPKTFRSDDDRIARTNELMEKEALDLKASLDAFLSLSE